MILNRRYRRSVVTVFQQAKAGQSVCGDSYYTIETDAYLLIAMADGLGSGPHAQKASQAMMRAVQTSHHLPVEQLVHACNEVARGTRGAVLGIMKLDYETSTVHYAGVGNIQLIIYSTSKHVSRPVFRPGYLIGRPIRVITYQFAYEKGCPLVMHSDGIEMPVQHEQRKMLAAEPDRWVEQSERSIVEDDDATLIISRQV